MKPSKEKKKRFKHTQQEKKPYRPRTVYKGEITKTVSGQQPVSPLLNVQPMVQQAERANHNPPSQILNAEDAARAFPGSIQTTITMATIRPGLRMFHLPVPLVVVLALWLGSAWFFYNLSIELPNRFRGDAATYWWLADSAKSLGEVMTSVDLKPPGFPTVIYILKNLASEVGFVWPQILNFMAIFFYLFHIGSCLAFFIVLKRLAGDNGIKLPVFPLCILFIHPALISYTTILVTDTFTADLLMIGITLLIYTRWAGQIGKVGLALLSGCTLGFCVLVRVAYGPPILASLVLYGLIVTWHIWRAHCGGQLRQKEGGVRALCTGLIVLAGFVLALIPSVLHCQATYGSVCIQNEKETRKNMIWSMKSGLDSPRLYWSGFAPPPDLINRVIDPFLAKNWASTCSLTSEFPALELTGCYLRNPHIGGIFLLKKILAVFDHPYLQPYAIDHSPRWVRLYSRLFGALAFAGFIGVAILFGMAVRRAGWPPEVILVTATTLCIVIFQAQFHSEGRYSFGALVGTYSALAWLWADIRSRPTMGRGLISAALGLAAIGFFIQTSYWDSIDPALRLIEKWP